MRRSEPINSPLYASFLEACPSGMLLIDASGNIINANTLAVEMFGYPRDTLLSLTVEALVPDTVRGHHGAFRAQYATAPTQRAMGTGRELLAQRRDGSHFPVEIGLNPIAQDGQRWVLCSVVDISVRTTLEAERQQALTQAMEAHRLESLGLLAGGVAHDFNNLLAAIIGNACFALDQVPERGQLHGCLSDIIEASEKAADLAQQMLAYSGRGSFQITELDVSTIVVDLAALLRATLPHHVCLRLQCPVNLPLIEGDAAQIRQILYNLVNNGAEAIAPPAEGRISVSTNVIEADEGYLAHFHPQGLRPGRYLSLEVSDNGNGMTPKVRDTIFEPFFTTKESGHGLGLAAVMGIIRAHKGGVRVYSEAGRGSTFKVLFPATSAAPSTPDAPTSKGTILFADDESIVRRFLRRLLHADGYDLIEAQDGQEAVTRFLEEQERVTLALLDLSMPRLDGIEAARQIHAASPQTPIIITSGFSEHESINQFKDVTLAGFLQKPYQPDTLLTLLRKTLDEA